MKLIEGVVYKDSKVKDLESTDINNWILKPRKIGKKKKQAQVIIEVLALVYLGKLIINAENELREERLSLELKTTILDCTAKVGITVSLNLRFALK